MEVNEPKTIYLTTGQDIKTYDKSDYLMPYTLTVGRIAESLIQELFLVENYQTYKFGLENTYQHLYKQLRYNKSDASQSLRKSPDLILYEPCDEKLYYAEIKYRSNSSFTFKENEFQDYETRFPNGFFFIVTPKDLYVISFEKMRDLKKVNFTDSPEYLLRNSKEFKLRHKSIEHIEKFLSVFYNSEFLKMNKRIQAEYRY